MAAARLAAQLLPPLLALAAGAAIVRDPDGYQPAADPKAVVESGSARFTVLTPRLIRCEYAPGSRFIDEPTYAVLNRHLPVPQFTSQMDTFGRLNIGTGAATVSYLKGSGFSSGSLSATADSGRIRWSFGQESHGNLGGTVRTLDGGLETIDLNCSRLTDPKDLRLNATEQHCTLGVASTEGWAVLDDTGMPIWPAGEPKENPGAHETGQVDIYLFLHGRDFKAALGDLALIGGRHALPPRYAFGTMFTRWYDFDDALVRAIVSRFEEHGFPLDVFIFDMNWHTHGPWGGYSWTRPEIPSPEGLQRWLRQKGLHTGANLHDADGVRADEDRYETLAAQLGVVTGKDISFQPTNASYITAVDDVLLAPLERCPAAGREGMSLWWIDYQQGERLDCGSVAKLSPTAVLNRARHGARQRRGENERGLILSRWPGMGGHRYAVGFTGDQQHTWKGLQFLPHFTATAANVGFGFWSHDMYGGTTSTDPEPHQQVDWELRTRWLQFGALSPIMRYHDKGEATGNCADTPDGCARISPFDVPIINYDLERGALIARAERLPYLYTKAWEATRTGVAVIRPVYVEFPESPAAYAAAATQYFLGDAITVAPVTARQDRTTLLTAWRIWVPPGEWWDALDGRVISGPVQATLNLDLSEQPMLVRGGATVPMKKFDSRQPLGNAQNNYGDLSWDIVLAAGGSGSGVVYEDDGHTLEHEAGKYLVTELRYDSVPLACGGRQVEVLLAVQSEGAAYSGCPAARDHVLRFRLAAPPAELRTSGDAKAAEWEVDPEGLGFLLRVRGLPNLPGASASVKISLPADDGLAACGAGLEGAARRLALTKAELDEANVDYSVAARGRLHRAAAVPAALRYARRGSWPAVLQGFWEDLAAAPAELKALKLEKPQEHRRARALALVAEALLLRPAGCTAAANKVAVRSLAV